MARFCSRIRNSTPANIQRESRSPGVSSLHLDQFSAAVLPCRSCRSLSLSPPVLYSPLLFSALFPPYFTASLALAHRFSLSLSLSFSHFLCLYPYAFAFFSSKRFGRRASIVPSVKRMHFKYCRTMKIQRRQWYKQFPSVKNRGGGRKIIFVLFAVSRSLLSYEGGRAC